MFNQQQGLGQQMGMAQQDVGMAQQDLAMGQPGMAQQDMGMAQQDMGMGQGSGDPIADAAKILSGIPQDSAGQFIEQMLGQMVQQGQMDPQSAQQLATILLEASGTGDPTISMQIIEQAMMGGAQQQQPGMGAQMGMQQDPSMGAGMDPAQQQIPPQQGMY